MSRANVSAGRQFSTGSAAILLAVLSGPALAHEFWLDAVNSIPKVATTVPIVHRNGQGFLGDSYPFIRSLTRRFVVIDAKGERAVKAVEGNDPAAEVKFSTPGLAIVAYHRDGEQVVFDTMARFKANLNEEGLTNIAAKHRRLGKPETGIRELFSRYYAKTLVQVGGVGGNDRAVGLALEIAAERNPYALGGDTSLPVRVLQRANRSPASYSRAFI